MEDDVVIRVKGLCKSFRIVDPKAPRKGFGKHPAMVDFPVFEGVDLEVRKGEVLGILGRNGCGKSTFMKLVSGILEPDRGTVEVEGKVASILELSMGFHGDLTGRENIFLRSELYGISREEVKAHIDDIIEYSDLGVFIDNPVRTYSSGMRSRLAFSVMVNVDAEIFIVDEALSTGDMAFASKASEHLRNLVRSGKTVLFTSHSLSTIKRTCTRAVWINDRRIAMDGSADEVCEAYSSSINDSFEETRHLAEGGSSSAQYRLAVFYRDGTGTDADPDKYRFWLEAASERGHPMAALELGDLVAGSDRARAMELYRQAADNGNYDARRKYALMVEDSKEGTEFLGGVLADLAGSGYPGDIFAYGDFLFRTAAGTEDRRKAFELVSEASEKGWMDADLLLARMYREGYGTPRDMDASIRCLVSAARRGSGKAMTILAETYYEGRNVPKDRAEAFGWYRMSALTGNPRSQYQVAVMLSEGDGTEKDQEEADRWFARSSSTMLNDLRLDAMDTLRSRYGADGRADTLLKEASRDYHPRSMMSLASRYDSGRGFKKSRSACISLTEKAALGPGSPRTRLAELYLSDDPDGKKDAILTLLNDAIAAGDGKAMYIMGTLYREGTLVGRDKDLYRRYIRMAAEHGDRQARMLIGKWKLSQKH